MANLRISIDNSAVVKRLERLEQRIDNPTILYKAWSNYLEAGVVNAFRSETAPDGERWAALAPSTLKRKQKSKGSRNRILRDTGSLYDSIAATVTATGAEVGTNQNVGIYSLGAIHQFGATIKNPGGERNLNFKVDSATGRSRFAKASKANFQQTVTVGAYTITIPPRPFLPLDAKGDVLPKTQADLMEILEDFLAIAFT